MEQKTLNISVNKAMRTSVNQVINKWKSTDSYSHKICEAIILLGNIENSEFLMNLMIALQKIDGDIRNTYHDSEAMVNAIDMIAKQAISIDYNLVFDKEKLNQIADLESLKQEDSNGNHDSISQKNKTAEKNVQSHTQPTNGNVSLSTPVQKTENKPSQKTEKKIEPKLETKEKPLSFPNMKQPIKSEQSYHLPVSIKKDSAPLEKALVPSPSPTVKKEVEQSRATEEESKKNGQQTEDNMDEIELDMDIINNM